jgi:hypothetical protein
VREMLRNWMDFLWFLTEFFSLGILLKTLFSPWERMNERYKGGLDIGNFAETILVNFLMRLVGFVIRALILLAGLFSIIVGIIMGAVIFVVWLLYPLVVFFLLALSIKFLFS